MLAACLAVLIAQDEFTPRQRRALVDLAHLTTAVRLFREWNGDAPRMLRDLVERPKDARVWPDGGFVPGGALPKDPWGHDYEYDPRDVRIWSWGADGKPGGVGEAQDLPPAPRKQDFVFDPWEAWNSFAVGAAVEYEVEASGQRMNQVKTLAKKDAEALKLECVMKFQTGSSTTESRFEEAVRKSETSWPPKGECGLCKKPFADHKDESRWTREKLKVGDRELECLVLEPAAKNCIGQDNPRMKFWYSREIPGWIVRSETGNFRMSAVRYEAR